MPIPRCTQCRQEIVEQQDRPSTSDSLEAEILRLDNSIAQLQRERSGLARKLNAVRASTRYLPTEILATIFEYATPPPEFDARSFRHEPTDSRCVPRGQHPSELSLVSSDWHRVITSTSRLWDTVSMVVDFDTKRTITSLLQLHLKNVGQRPFSLYLEMLENERGGDPIDDSDVLRELFSVICHPDNARKFVYILLINPSQWMKLEFFRNPGFVELEELGILSDVYDTDHLGSLSSGITSSNLPTLRRLNLSLITDTNLLSTTLTTLVLSNMSVSSCIQLLLCCLEYPNIVEFRCRLAYDPIPLLKNVAIIRTLKAFEWACTGALCYPFLTQLQLPGLETLSLGTPDDESLSEFLSHIPKSCSTYELSTCGGVIEPARAIFDQLPQVRCLVVEGEDPETLCTVFSYLQSQPQGAAASTPCMPRLNQITWKCLQSEYRDVHENVPRFFIDMVESRKDCWKQGISFVYSDHNIRWSEEDLYALKDLQKDGIVLWVLDKYRNTMVIGDW
ncbi:hypothetical protein P691DRAFT_412767 [Macrolepiota fuliginosa MF-IS2]|uniref:F-box domain-containing protein n=1 Tax=Macrolepiota fuliginosa MF-IS2 TaxID=1400762 RepID=A0A9P5X2M0_9AGAR|nr:hypothetical protein P691DRAFT_412767 [Macrolepiota fuliginosa MF-IS2]